MQGTNYINPEKTNPKDQATKRGLPTRIKTKPDPKV